MQITSKNNNVMIDTFGATTDMAMIPRIVREIGLVIAGSIWSTAISMIIGNIIIYLFGISWLSQFVGWDNVLQTGFLPFLIGDAAKIALATILLPSGWKLLNKSSN